MLQLFGAQAGTCVFRSCSRLCSVTSFTILLSNVTRVFLLLSGDNDRIKLLQTMVNGGQITANQMANTSSYYGECAVSHDGEAKST